MLVELRDGCCRNCGGQLEIVHAEDALLTVVCLECGDGYDVEPDAFADGGIVYWPQQMAEQDE